MRHKIWLTGRIRLIAGLLLAICIACIDARAAAGNDSLLLVLDKVIAERAHYTELRTQKIRRLKEELAHSLTPLEQYNLHNELIYLYETFVCDSTEGYIAANARLARQLKDEERVLESKLRLAFVYSISGFFIQANDLFEAVNYDSLPDNLKALYCWGRIRFYENLIRYTDDSQWVKGYISEKEEFRAKVMRLLPKGSEEYLKEEAAGLIVKGEGRRALSLLLPLLERQQRGTHGHAMLSMAVARAFALVGEKQQEERYLIEAAMDDVQLAIKENEALLSLAMTLYHKGDINRAYRYVKVVLDDARFYNSRFKNGVIARIHPVIEQAYLHQLEAQKRTLRTYMGLVILFAAALAIALFFVYRQIHIVSCARERLKGLNADLSELNKQLDEANLTKEKYIGYFINQCAHYINYLDEYRKYVNRKVKVGQADELARSSSVSPFQQELDDLHLHFDRAFLKLYPGFVDAFNALLPPDKGFHPEPGRLSTELRIFALMRLGITEVGQIATFLHYSSQTIYNYKSKVKTVALAGSEKFEEQVMRIGSLNA